MSSSDYWHWDFDTGTHWEEKILWGIHRGHMALHFSALMIAYVGCFSLEHRRREWNVDFYVQYSLS